MTPALRERIRILPSTPGVYLFKDAKGRVLYVGKARSLRSRVSQYAVPKHLEPSKHEMIRAATTVDSIVTRNDMEALALEASLIRQYEPPYNVRLVDDSSYLYVRISKETVPKVELVRRVQPDNAWYRGPYPVASAIRSTLKEARKLFPWCALRDLGASKGKPCFATHLGLCPGICAGAITIEEYQRIIEGLKRFLDGNTRDAVPALRARMQAASAAEDYERAAKLRDTITAIEQVTTPQDAVTSRQESADVLGLARDTTHAVVAVLAVRSGRILHVRTFHLIAPEEEPPSIILRGFLVAYLARSANGAADILLPHPVDDAALLATRGATPVRFSMPQRGWKRQLLDLARMNAEDALARTRAELTSPAALQDALRTLARVLHLERPPRRIEGYDISNIHGVFPTGSLVVCIDGKERRGEYRRFRIDREGTPDDVAMMKEMLRRRLTKTRTTELPNTDRWPLPDLIIVDGGKGQLHAALDVLAESHLDIPCAALAKREEELFVCDRRQRANGHPRKHFRMIRLPRTSPALFLLQRLRDEAHRFTLGYHQLLRNKRMTHSLLEEIPGVGDATRKKLLRAFGSLRGIRSAAEAELVRVVGHTLAHRVQNFLH